MAPHSRIVLCRHSQAEHNVELDYTIPDAPLTPLGKEQSAALATVPAVQQLCKEVDLLVTSPLKRTLQSTQLGWGAVIERVGIENVICLPQAQGSLNISETAEFEHFNFELLTPDWTSKQGFYSADRSAIAKRAAWVRRFLRDRPEKTIVLVAHGDILRQITSSPNGPSTHMWQNAEVREYKFDPEHVETDDCFLIAASEIAVTGGHDSTSSSAAFKAHV